MPSTKEVKALRADISRAAALRKEVETLKARLAALSGDERSSPGPAADEAPGVALAGEAELEGEVERLRSLNRQLQQATYGRRSERRCRSQRRGAGGHGAGRGQVAGAAAGGAGAWSYTAPGVAGGRADPGAAGAMVSTLRAALCGERCIGDAAHRGRGLGLCASYPSSSHPGKMSVRSRRARRWRRHRRGCLRTPPTG